MGALGTSIYFDHSPYSQRPATEAGKTLDIYRPKAKRPPTMGAYSLPRKLVFWWTTCIGNFLFCTFFIPLIATCQTSFSIQECMAGTTGLEPATSAVTGQRSNLTELRPLS